MTTEHSLLIGLHGRAQAGKDTAYERLLLVGANMGYAVVRRSFADLLYTSAARSLNVTEDALRRWKTDPNIVIEIYDTEHNISFGAMTVREYLQRCGTEAHRETFGDNFWVDQLDLEVRGHFIVAVTDVRFPNEAERIRNEGGILVRVYGPPDVEEVPDGHASEQTLPMSEMDYILNNAIRDDDFRALDEQLSVMIQVAASHRRVTA